MQAAPTPHPPQPTTQPADDSVEGLLALARQVMSSTDRSHAERLVASGRQQATADLVEQLLDRAIAHPEPALLATALRFRGAAVVTAVLKRLFRAQGRAERRALHDLTVRLGGFAEVRPQLSAHLAAMLDRQEPEVIREAVALLAAIGGALPVNLLWQVARSPVRTHRLAMVDALSRSRSNPEVIELLVSMLDDGEPGLRFAAVLALGGHVHPGAREALRRRLAVETDPQTRTALERQLGRASVARRTA